MSLNTDGKDLYQCSCGYQVYLTPQEIPKWQTDHQSIFFGIPHKLTQISAPTEKDNNLIMAQVLSKINDKLDGKK